RIDCSAGNYDDLAGVLLSRAVSLNNDFCHRASRGASFETRHERIGKQGEVRILEGRIHAHYLRVGLRVDKAWMAIACCASNAFACSGVLLVQHDADWHMKRSESQATEIVAQLLDARLVANRRIRVRPSRPWLGGVCAAFPVHLVELL